MYQRNYFFLMKLLVFDNYDSFTYNLVHLVEKILGQKVDVVRNDKVDPESLDDYDRIILSPGPGLPAAAGSLLPLILQKAASASILGVCLGHQAIAEAFGGRLINLTEVFHGKSSAIRIVQKNNRLFHGLPDVFMAGRYHSWVVDPAKLPDSLLVTALDEKENIMALQHKQYDINSVQFHPESIMTPLGEQMIRNWLMRS